MTTIFTKPLLLRGALALAFVALLIPSASGVSLVVTNSNDSGAGSLRQTVLDAASGGTLNITFDPALSGKTITLASQILITTNVVIDASDLSAGIHVNGNAVTRVFYVTNGAVATFKSLTIENGLAPAGDFFPGGGGGGVFIRGQLTMLNCSVVSNRIASDVINSFAAGVAIDQGANVRMTNCTIAFNKVPPPSSSLGGGIFNYQGVCILDHCTVVGNEAASFGGMVAQGNTTIRASVFANTNADLFNLEAGLSVVDTFIANGNNSGQTSVNGNQVGTSGSPLNPVLAPLGNYGGPTPTMPPLPGSPLINTATNTVGTVADQRGYPRPVGLAADIGAVEGIYNAAGPGKISSITKLGNGSAQFNFTNLTDAVFPVLASTNVSAPLSNWIQIGFAVESPLGSGQFPFTDTQATNNSQRFYRVRSP